MAIVYSIRMFELRRRHIVLVAKVSTLYCNETASRFDLPRAGSYVTPLGKEVRSKLPKLGALVLAVLRALKLELQVQLLGLQDEGWNNVMYCVTPISAERLEGHPSYGLCKIILILRKELLWEVDHTIMGGEVLIDRCF